MYSNNSEIEQLSIGLHASKVPRDLHFKWEINIVNQLQSCSTINFRLLFFLTKSTWHSSIFLLLCLSFAMVFRKESETFELHRSTKISYLRLKLQDRWSEAASHRCTTKNLLWKFIRISHGNTWYGIIFSEIAR